MYLFFILAYNNIKSIDVHKKVRYNVIGVKI